MAGSMTLPGAKSGTLANLANLFNGGFVRDSRLPIPSVSGKLVCAFSSLLFDNPLSNRSRIYIGHKIFGYFRRHHNLHIHMLGFVTFYCMRDNWAYSVGKHYKICTHHLPPPNNQVVPASFCRMGRLGSLWCCDQKLGLVGTNPLCL